MSLLLVIVLLLIVFGGLPVACPSAERPTAPTTERLRHGSCSLRSPLHRRS